MSLGRGIVFTFLAQAPTLVLYFVSSVFMTRLLGEAGRGSYTLLQSLVVLLSMLFGFSMALGITYHTAKGRESTVRVVRIAATGLLLNMVLVPLMLALVFLDPALRNIFLDPGITHWGYYMYVLVAIIAGMVNGYISSIFLGLKKFRIINRLGIFFAGLNAVGISLLYMAKESFPVEQALPLVLAISIACILIMTLIWCVSYAREVGIMPVPTFDLAVLRPFFAFVLINYLSDLINLVNYRFDVWVVGKYAGTAELGLYAVAVGLGQLFFYVPEPFSRVVQPYLYEGLNPATISKYKFISRVNFTLVAGLCLVLGLSAAWVIPLLYGDAFLPSAPTLYWLLPGIAFISSSKLLTPLIIQGGLIRFNLYATSTTAVITIFLDFALVPVYGIKGAALASTVAYGCLLAFQCAVVKVKMNIRIHDIFMATPADICKMRHLLKDRILKLQR